MVTLFDVHSIREYKGVAVLGAYYFFLSVKLQVLYLGTKFGDTAVQEIVFFFLNKYDLIRFVRSVSCESKLSVSEFVFYLIFFHLRFMTVSGMTY